MPAGTGKGLGCRWGCSVDAVSLSRCPAWGAGEQGSRGTGEQGNRATGEQGRRPANPEAPSPHLQVGTTQLPACFGMTQEPDKTPEWLPASHVSFLMCWKAAHGDTLFWQQEIPCCCPARGEGICFSEDIPWNPCRFLLTSHHPETYPKHTEVSVQTCQHNAGFYMQYIPYERKQSVYLFTRWCLFLQWIKMPKWFLRTRPKICTKARRLGAGSTMSLTDFGENKTIENVPHLTLSQAFLNECARSITLQLITEVEICLPLYQSRTSKVRNQNYNTTMPISELNCNYGNLHSQYLTETVEK